MLFRFAGRSASRSIVVGLLVLLGCWLTAAARSLSAEPELVGVLALAVDEEVAGELRLSPQQRSSLLKLIDAREEAGLELALEVKDLPAAERATRLEPFRKQSEERGLALLSQQQKDKLEQVRLRRLGYDALADAATAGRLQLDAAQRARVEETLKRRETELRASDVAELAKIRERFQQELADLLTDEQRARWRELTEGPLAAADADDPPQRRPLPEAERGRPGAAQDDLADLPAKAQPRGDGKLRFNFRYQPWADVLDWFAEQAELSLVLDAPPPGTFNYTDPRAYTPAEAIDLINSVLLTKGYTLVRRERMLMLVNLEDGIPANLVPAVPLARLDERGEHELVSVLFQLRKMTPEEAETEINKLLGPQGSVIVLPKARQIQVTETAGRVRTIRAVIDAVENPEQLGERFEQFQLEHVSAAEVMPVVRQLLNLGEADEGAADATLRVALDPTGRRLLVSGKSDRIAQLKEILSAVDVPDGLVGAEPGVVAAPQLEVYVVAPADPQAVLQVLQTLLAGQGDVRLALDPRTGNLVALARPAQHATIRATLGQMQQDSHQLEVIQLRRVDPQAAVLAINKLFGAAEGEAANAPKVDADPISRSLMVRGNQRQVAQIRDLLTKLGEGEAEGEVASERTNVRMVPLYGRTVRSALEQVEQVWPTMRSNPIRVVSPSGASGIPRSVPAPPSVGPPARPRPVSPDQRQPPKEEAPPSQPDPGDDAKPEGAKPEGQEKSARRAAPIFLVSQAGDQASEDSEVESAAAAAPEAEPEAPQEKPAPSDAGAFPALPESASPSAGAAPIIVIPGPGGTMIASEDLDALDEFEALLTATANRAASGREFAVFYLKHSQAAVIAETLREVLGGGGSDDGGSLLGDLAGAALGDLGGGLLGTLMGMGGGGGGGVITSGSLTIVPDARLNALVVHGRPAELDTMEQLLEILDQHGSPEEVHVASKAQVIPVYNTSAQEVAAVVEQVYKDRMIAAAGPGQQASPQDLLRALRGGRRGGGGGSTRDPQASVERMSIGVDARSNSLIVSAPQNLFEEVKALVAQLDQVQNSSETMRVVTLKRSNPQAVGQALSSILGGAVQTHTTAAEQPAAKTPDRRPGSPAPAAGPPPTDAESIQQRVEFFDRLRRFRESQGAGSGSSGGGSSRSRPGSR